MSEWMTTDVVERARMVGERLDTLRAEAETERMVRHARHAARDDGQVRVRFGLALVRAGTALAGECNVARLRPRHP